MNAQTHEQLLLGWGGGGVVYLFLFNPNILDSITSWIQYLGKTVVDLNFITGSSLGTLKMAKFCRR